MGEYITKPVCKVLMLKGEKGSGSTWGDIDGDLSDQQDLMMALNNRADRTAITNISVDGGKFTATRSNGTTFDFTLSAITNSQIDTICK